MIGDTSHDLEMARAAGVDALAVTYGAHRGDRICAHCGPQRLRRDVTRTGKWLTTHG